MPRVVDHEARRAEVAAAVWRIVARDGVEAITVRGVAAETGMSTSVVSHYFADKDDLLRLAFHLVVERASSRVAQAETGGRARALLVSALPLDDEQRMEARTWFSLLGLAIARPELAADQRRTYAAWRAAVAGALRDEGIDPGRDADSEAAALIALVDGLTVQAAFAPAEPELAPERQLGLVDERLRELGIGS
jgi:TetR/AcrR family transcriptional regulator, transcriptional repressor of bet genes